ncbi:hypothetical protein HW509_10780 [Asaia spathodeae]|uniref:hypothetical protein n=1 Tax=Asaia spathodeae TaxID=657016 RepID=UPI002FC3ABE5
MASFFWGDGGEALSQDELERRRQQAQALASGGANQEVHSWTQALSNVVNQLLGGWQMHDYNGMQEENESYNKDLVQGLLHGGSGALDGQPQPRSADQAPAVVSAAGSAQDTAAQNAASDMIADDYFKRVKQVESGNNLVARALTSSATGPYQFTDGTWRGVMKQHPDLGLTLDGRTDPMQADAAVRALSSDNIAYMMQHGVQNPNDGQKYLAHFAGAPTASRLINADPATPVSALMSSGQIAANPFLRGMTAGDVQNWASNRIGSSPAAQPIAVPQRAAVAQPMVAPSATQQQGPDQTQLTALLSDPRANQQTRSIAASLLQNQMQQQQADRAAQQEQQTWLARQNYQQQQQANDPLRQAQIAEYGARADALRQKMNAPAGPAYSMLSPQQAQSMGLDPRKSYQVGPDGKIGEIGNSGVNVTLNNGPTTSEFQKKSDDAAADRLGGYIQEGNTAPAVIGQLQQLSDLSRNIGTGKGAQLQGQLASYAQTIGLNLDPKLGDKQAFSAIVDRMAPQMRPVGSGSSSDTDVRMFMNSLPQLGNTDRGNQIITGTMQALQQNKLQAAEIASQAQRGQMSWQDAEAQIRKLPNPYDQFRKAHADLTTNGSAPSGQSVGAAQSQPQYRAGQRARLADGSIVAFNGTSWVREN